MKKKADGNMMWIVVTAAILLVFMVIYLVGWKNLFGKGVGNIGDQIAATGDFDNDMVINLKDKCPCQIGDISNSGCSASNPDESRKCLEDGK